MEHDLQVEQVPWDSLTQHPENPRSGDVDAIEQSIAVNGVFRPVIVSSDSVILAGHHLWTAIGSRGGTQVSVIRLDVKGASAEAKRIMLADNRTSDLGRYDEGLLVDLLQSLNAEVGLLGSGYDDDAIARLLDDGFSDDGTPGLPVDTQYNVLVMCESESGQTTFMEQMRNDGREVKAVMT